MPEIETSADLFLLAASVSVVVLTLALLLAGYFVIRAAQEVRELVQAVRTEVAVFSANRRRILLQTKFLGKWLRLFPAQLYRQWAD